MHIGLGDVGSHREGTDSGAPTGIPARFQEELLARHRSCHCLYRYCNLPAGIPLANICQLVLVADAVIWLTVVALLTHASLEPESANANGDVTEDVADDKTCHMLPNEMLAV